MYIYICIYIYICVCLCISVVYTYIYYTDRCSSVEHKLDTPVEHMLDTPVSKHTRRLAYTPYSSAYVLKYLTLGTKKSNLQIF